MTTTPPPPPRIRGAPPPFLVGLVNPTGNNRCFLNAVVQAMRHTKGFSTRFKRDFRLHLDSLPEQHSPESCVTCEFLRLLLEMEDADGEEERGISSQRLHDAVAVASSGRVGVRDTMETFLIVIEQLHRHLGVMNEECTCVAHEYFGMSERTEGTCGRCGVCESIGNATTSFVVRLPVIVFESTEDALEMAISRFLSSTSVHECSWCRSEVRAKPEIARLPKSIATEIGLTEDADLTRVWEALRPQIMNLTVALGVKGVKPRWGRISAMVCYYGNHYVAVAYNSRAWWLMDDCRVRELGKDFGVVVEWGKSGRWFPQVVIWEVLPGYFVFKGETDGDG